MTVTYTLVGQGDQIEQLNGDAFQGQFTITNNGAKPVHGWELRVQFPSDNVNAVWDAHFHMVGDTVVMDPRKSQVTIPPGASLTENISAEGPTTSPTSCTFNGSPC